MRAFFPRPSTVLALLVPAWLFVSVAAAADGERPSVLLVPFDGTVDLGRTDLVESAVKRAVEEKPVLLLLRVNSPGGRVDYMERILHALATARERGVRTAVFVDGNAWSAAAILAIASDAIYMRPNASLGAAEPVYLTDKGMESAGEKVVSAMRTQARAQAEQSGRPAALAEAMVDADTVVLEVMDRGRRRFLTALEWDDLREESYREGFEAFVKSTVVEKGKLLSLSAKQAVAYGLADGLASSIEDVLRAESLEAAEVEVMRLTGFQWLANLLTSPALSILLFLLGIGGIYIELKTPGFGIPGIVGAICIFLFFFGKYAVGLAEIYEILIFTAGVVLLGVEIFLTPGFGVPGVAGVVLMIAGIFLASQDFLVPDTPMKWDDFQWNVFQTGAALGGAVVFLAILASVLPRSFLVKRMALSAPSTVEASGSAVRAPDVGLVGMEGLSETPLRPAGIGRFADRRLNVVSEGDWVGAGEGIRVVRVEGMRVVVIPKTPGAREEEGRS